MRTNGFTLYPDGAFMMCESIGEFDPNVPLPEEKEIQSVPVEQVPTYVDQVLVPKCQVEQVIKELTPVYNAVVQPCMDMGLDTSTDEMIAQTAEKISQAATTVCDAIQMQLSRLAGPYAAINDCDQYIYGSCRRITGIYLKNRDVISRDGYDYALIQVRSSRVFNLEALNITNKLVDLKDVISNGMLDFSIVDDMTYNSNPLSKYCQNVPGLLHLAFQDYDKLVRFENVESSSYSIEEMVRRVINMDDRPIAIYNEYEGINRFNHFLKELSHYTRKIKQKMYMIQCELLEHESDFAHMNYNKEFFRATSLIVNLFALGTTIALSEAYEINAMVSRKESIESYCDMIQKKYIGSR